MRERHATCGREAKSTVFAKDMAEGCIRVVFLFRLGLRCGITRSRDVARVLKLKRIN